MQQKSVLKIAIVVSNGLNDREITSWVVVKKEKGKKNHWTFRSRLSRLIQLINYSGVSIGELVRTGFGYTKKGFTAGFNVLRPSHLRKSKQRALNKLASMTYGQLLITTGKLTFRSIYLFMWSIYFFLATLCRFILFMMGGRKDEDVDFAALPMPESRRLNKEPSQNYSPVLADLQPDTGTHIEAFGIHIAPEENTDGSRKLNMQQADNNKNSSQSGNDSADEKAADSSPEAPSTPTPPVVNETAYFVPPTSNLAQVHKPARYILQLFARTLILRKFILCIIAIMNQA